MVPKRFRDFEKGIVAPTSAPAELATLGEAGLGGGSKLLARILQEFFPNPELGFLMF